jgi:predicted transposase/invertase (TIGR01784 family)
VEGRAEGRTEGRAEGREEGRAEERLKTARSLLEENASFDLIRRVTGLSEDEISSLR